MSSDKSEAEKLHELKVSKLIDEYEQGCDDMSKGETLYNSLGDELDRTSLDEVLPNPTEAEYNDLINKLVSKSSHITEAEYNDLLNKSVKTKNDETKHDDISPTNIDSVSFILEEIDVQQFSGGYKLPLSVEPIFAAKVPESISVNIVNEFHNGTFGEVVYQHSDTMDRRAQAVIHSATLKKVVYREGFNEIIGTSLKDRSCIVKTSHTKTFIGSKINNCGPYNCFYLKQGLLSQYSNIFSNNFNVSVEILAGNKRKITFYVDNADKEIESNMALLHDVCKRNNVKFVSVQTQDGKSFDYLDMGRSDIRFNVECLKTGNDHNVYKLGKPSEQILACTWSNLVDNKIYCPACTYAANREKSRRELLSILFETDKLVQCEKILDFVEKMH